MNRGRCPTGDHAVPFVVVERLTAPVDDLGEAPGRIVAVRADVTLAEGSTGRLVTMANRQRHRIQSMSTAVIRLAATTRSGIAYALRDPPLQRRIAHARIPTETKQ